MKIPKYIDKLLDKRAKSAMDFMSSDCQIAEWLEKNGIDVPSDDICTGACALMEPYSSINSIRECILSK